MHVCTGNIYLNEISRMFFPSIRPFITTRWWQSFTFLNVKNASLRFFLSTLASSFRLRPINHFYGSLCQFYFQKRKRRFCSTLRLIYRAFSTATVLTFKFSSIFFLFCSFFVLFSRERGNQISFSLAEFLLSFHYPIARKR